ncbi:TIGR03086 family metal-binding protein [Streptomyces sp. NPDC049881]|uniref:TIGR03086 family metal-binding protein n=1 Tax=Streptomyces sp. NPDC049881 TaxID=3155778 RepID=UPI00342CED1A
MSDTEATPSPSGADPRPGFFRAAALAGETIAAVRLDQYGAASPCPDFDAEQLARHLIAVLRRVAVSGGGGHPFSVDSFADVPAGEWTKAWQEATAEAEAVWSDPAILGRTCELGFVTLPGAAAIVVYTTEISLHTWDLARATGQEPAWDDAALAPSVAAMRFAVPAEPRGGPVPFGPVVEVPDDAPLIDRLAGWYGRQP